VPGFVAYYVVRSGNGDASIMICQDQSGTAEATRLAVDRIRQNLLSVTGSPPEVTEGEVSINFGLTLDPRPTPPHEIQPDHRAPRQTDSRQ
jgi:hypothetical protein